LIFAWEGFSLRHPDDWAPVTITGGRSEGYVRIASTGKLACQVRWKHASSAPDLSRRLETYLDRLRADARKAKGKLETHTETEPDALSYQYGGFANGRGRIFYDAATQRVFFVELTSTKADRLGTPFRDIESSFETGPERWAVLGLDFTLPGELKVERKNFLSGRTTLVLGNRGVTVEAQRWGFGEQLAAKHGLTPWSMAALEMKGAAVFEQEDRVALERTGIFPTYGLVKLQKEQNQIVTLKVKTRSPEWRPTWDWLA
jgi:hypothetical protein